MVLKFAVLVDETRTVSLNIFHGWMLLLSLTSFKLGCGASFSQLWFLSKAVRAAVFGQWNSLSLRGPIKYQHFK